MSMKIHSKDQYKSAKLFYDKIAYGGIIIKHFPNGGEITKMKDGSNITYRKVTSSINSPAIEINIRRSIDPCGLKSLKIHFMEK